MQWSKRVSFGAGILGGTIKDINTSSVLFDGVTAYFYGEATVPSGNLVKYGLYRINLNRNNGQSVEGKITYLPNARTAFSNYNNLFPFQKAIAFPLTDGTHSVVFREIYNSANGIVSNLVNLKMDLSGKVLTARYINRNPVYPASQLSRLISGRTEYTIDKNNNIVFFDKGIKGKRFAVVSSSNQTLLTRSLSSLPSPDPEANNIDFIHGGSSISLHVTDSSGTVVSQQINTPLSATDSLTGCLTSDTAFFTVSPLTITAAPLAIDSTRSNIFSAVDMAVNVEPYTFTRVELCKKISTCSGLKITGDSLTCTGSIYRLSATRNAGCYQKIDWGIDTTLFSILQSSDSLLLLSPRHTGTAIIKATLNNCVVADSITVSVYPSVQPFSLGADTSLCAEDGVMLRLPAGVKAYQWSTGSSAQQLYVSVAGRYWGKAIDACGNTYSDTITIRRFPAPVLHLGQDTSLCAGIPYLLGTNNHFVSYLWSTGATTSQIVVAGAGQYWLRATDSNGCSISDTVIIHNIYPTPDINLPDIPERCIGQNDTLFAGNGHARYVWQDGSTSTTYSVKKPGVYWVTVSNEYGCRKTDTTKITQLNALPVNFITGDSLLCSLEKGKLYTTKSYQSYLWSNGSGQSTITVQAPGNYWLTATDAAGCTGTDSLIVKQIECKNQIHFPTAFTPNGDGLNDVFKPVVSGRLASYVLTIYNRYGQKVFEAKDAGKGWDGSMNRALLPTGNYVWSCTYQFLQMKLTTAKGSLIVIR